MPITAETYERIALEDPEGRWELHRGRLRGKPGMSFAHNQTIDRLSGQFYRQLDISLYAIRINHGHVNRTDETYYIPDLFVVPLGLDNQDWTLRNVLETYGQPLPLVVEVWSPSTGGYDVDAKFPEYQRRGDIEIWRIHPFDRVLTAWRRQPSGEYAVLEYRDGTVEPVALPGVKIDLDALFAR
ncbi:MAG: Uma2 family endonuclease [Chloroflexota bacterium]|nr:Uma2 family endonuclease [Chloroflexota bacterium]